MISAFAATVKNKANRMAVILVKFLIVNISWYGKGVQPFLCLPFIRLPPSYHTHNKHRTVHAYTA